MCRPFALTEAGQVLIFGTRMKENASIATTLDQPQQSLASKINAETSCRFEICKT